MKDCERIKQIRHALGLTQIKFAERIGISSSYLAAMETGDKKVNDRTIRLIGMEFGINEHWLRTGEGMMYNDEEEMNIAKITSLFKSLSPKFQKYALIQFNTLVEFYNSCKK